MIAWHAAVTYRVYRGRLRARLRLHGDRRSAALPRRAAPSPRLAVPAGSVAIAAGQTGIYPAETPGGWNIIGRTPVKPYDPARPSRSSFMPAIASAFARIDATEFDRTTRSDGVSAER